MLERDGGWGAAVTIPIDRTRVAFAVPWAGRLLVGTTDSAFEGDARTIAPTAAEERQILEEAALALDVDALGPVRARFAGVRVLPVGAVATARAHRETMLSSGPLGMVSVAGGKLTTYRRIALAVLHQLRAELELHRIDRRPRPLPGAADPDVAADALRRRHTELDQPLAAHLAGTYGSLAEEVIAAGPLEPLGEGVLEVEAQVLYAREREWAVSAEDVLRRRTTLAVTGRDSDEVRRRVEALLAIVILAIDQGTTGTTCLAVDGELRVRGRGYREFPQYYPQPGWVEHDPEELWESVLGAAEDAVRTAGIRPSELAAIGITNQRETTILWERASGRAGGAGDRLAGPAHRRALPRAARRAAAGADRPRPRPLLLRHQARVAARAHRPAARGARFRDGRLVAGLEADRRPCARHRPDERVPDDAPRPRHPRLGGRAARTVRRRSGAAAPARPLLGGRRRGRAARRHAPDRGHRGRPAGGAVRPRLLRARPGEGDLRHRQLRACERRS